MINVAIVIVALAVVYYTAQGHYPMAVAFVVLLFVLLRNRWKL